MIESVRALSEHELRRLVILAQDLLERRGAGRVPEGSKITYRLEEVKCGKAACTRCPHGPYWYAYWREEGRLKSRYLGSARAKAGADRARQEVGRLVPGRPSGPTAPHEPTAG